GRSSTRSEMVGFIHCLLVVCLIVQLLTQTTVWLLIWLLSYQNERTVSKEFCVRLSQRTKKEYRLPSEAEWEYACRAGTTNPFHFGKIITTDYVNYDGNYTYGESPKGKYREQTTPVGYFKTANAFGLYDMHGNVFEWCEDDYHHSYEKAPTDGSAWLNDKYTSKIIRGGSWDNRPNFCRCAFRYFNEFVYGLKYIGLRVVGVAPRILS
ncbi:MAG: formylglycine-generating enzyme family protein, partial [Coleofasciculus sp. D1-CHI-01]|uniref:formylglycine-generating enzyme family protein n=1 Tax=Coleofasciculus sp. D1-CHI-01 TaxID=3068482 RepID=UPI0032F1D7EA